MSDFFDKLKKGMNVAPAPIPQVPAEAKEPEVVLTSTEIIGETPKKKRVVKKKKTSLPKPEKEGKIEVKQEAILSKEIKDEDKDIFQKEGQLTIDVFETDKDIIIQSAIAGVKPEDLDISIEKDMVSIKGKRERCFKEEAKNFFHQECYWGRFSRELVLPKEVDSSKAQAELKNGVLTITVPKI